MPVSESFSVGPSASGFRGPAERPLFSRASLFQMGVANAFVGGDDVSLGHSVADGNVLFAEQEVLPVPPVMDIVVP